MIYREGDLVRLQQDRSVNPNFSKWYYDRKSEIYKVRQTKPYGIYDAYIVDRFGFFNEYTHMDGYYFHDYELILYGMTIDRAIERLNELI